MMLTPIPGFLGTHAGFLSDLSLTLVITAAIVSLVGYYFIRFQNNNKVHHYTLIASVIILALFLVVYVLNSILYGTNVFKGPSFIHYFVYWPFLIIHISFAMILALLYLYQLLTALKHSRTPGKIIFKDPAYIRMHRKLGTIGLILIVVTAITGSMVYAFLYIWYP